MTFLIYVTALLPLDWAVTVHLFLHECITCKVKSCSSNYCTFHISYVTTITQNNKKITSMKKNNSWWTSCRSCWSGQRFSSTSHLMFSLPWISLTAAHIPCNDPLWCPHIAFNILCSMIIYFPPPFSQNASDCAVGNLHILYMLPNLIG